MNMKSVMILIFISLNGIAARTVNFRRICNKHVHNIVESTNDGGIDQIQRDGNTIDNTETIENTQLIRNDEKNTDEYNYSDIAENTNVDSNRKEIKNYYEFNKNKTSNGLFVLNTASNSTVSVDSQTDKQNLRSENTTTENKDQNKKELGIGTDITNIREVRQQLLDHMLEYFMNIIQDDNQYTETGKKFKKDKMKVEEKLRNYYIPGYLEQHIYGNETDDSEMESHNSHSDEELSDTIKTEYNVEKHDKTNSDVTKNEELLGTDKIKVDDDPKNETIDSIKDETVVEENQHINVESDNLLLQNMVKEQPAQNRRKNTQEYDLSDNKTLTNEPVGTNNTKDTANNTIPHIYDIKLKTANNTKRINKTEDSRVVKEFTNTKSSEIDNFEDNSEGTENSFYSNFISKFFNFGNNMLLLKVGRTFGIHPDHEDLARIATQETCTNNFELQLNIHLL